VISRAYLLLSLLALFVDMGYLCSARHEAGSTHKHVMRCSVEAWIAGLLGTLVGASGSVAGIWIQSYFQTRRERLKLVMEIAMQDRKDSIQLAKDLGQTIGPIAPIALFAHYHAELFKLIESGKLTNQTMHELYRSNTLLGNIIMEVDAKRKGKGL